jgi:phosphoglycerol transferase MdoB-like AlkP superfamily enzyme
MLTNDLTSDVVKRTFKLFAEKKYKIQILFFSATYTSANIKFIKQYYKKCYVIQVKKEELNLTNVTQFYYYAKDDNDKIDFISQYLSLGIQERIVIFAHSKNFAVSLQKKLRDKGYYTFSMHGNNGDFWNRRIMHANLGYDTLYAKNTYDIDEVVGLGISDVSFFRQSVEKIKTINEEHDKFFGYIITLSNHTPFSDVDKYGEFAVDIKEGDNVYPYMEGTKLGRYLKSVHYADYALGLFFDALDKEGLLDNTAIVFFGDHDARLPKDDFDRLYNYDKATNDVLPSTDPNYKEVNDYTYEIDRKTPLIIWSKSTENKAKKVSYFMGMYDVMPTLGNMMGFSNKYALGHDIFNIKDNNIIVFPTSNWLTKDMYYNSQKAEGYAISTGIIGDDYIAKNSKYAEELLKVSNDILIYDLIRNSNAEASKINENKIVEGASQ